VDTEVTVDIVGCAMESPIMIVVAVFMEATEGDMEVDMEDRGGPIGPTGLMDTTCGPNGLIGPRGGPGPYEPKYPVLRMVSYDSYYPLSRI